MAQYSAVFSKLSVGDIIIGLTHEVLSAEAMIVDYKGSLIRVVNQTEYDFRVGEQVTLRVIGIGPLRFKLLSSFTSRSPEQNG